MSWKPWLPLSIQRYLEQAAFAAKGANFEIMDMLQFGFAPY